MDVTKFFKDAFSPVQLVEDRFLLENDIRLYIKRDDLLHPKVSGNKMRKIKYNIVEALANGHDTILTFGGAYSNHIFAIAASGEIFGIKTIGIIRGEAYESLNPTLEFARKCGMQLHYVNRIEYRERNNAEFLNKIRDQFGEVYILPEGGSNALAVKGCAEIKDEIIEEYDVITVCCGTGGTMAGIIAGLDGNKSVLGFPVLKGGDFLRNDIRKLIRAYNGNEYINWQLETRYHFGGYAKFKTGLVEFINNFKRDHGIQLDPIYTGKMFYGIYDLILKGEISPGTKIMAIHSGGLQGIAGFNQRYNDLIKV